MKQEQVIRRARALIGTRFRPQGRCAANGVDCIGMAAIAGGAPLAAVRRDYALRQSDPAVLTEGFVESGFVEVAVAEAQAGDMLVVEVGFSQLHVVVLTPDGFVHADAGIRRVVEVPGAVAWPVVSAWRVGG